MEFFEKISADLRKRSDERAKKASESLDEELYQIFYRNYYNVRERTFGLSDLTALQSEIVKETAFSEYRRELRGYLPELRKKTLHQPLIVPWLCGMGLCFTAADVFFDDFFLGFIGAALPAHGLYLTLRRMYSGRPSAFSRESKYTLKAYYPVMDNAFYHRAQQDFEKEIKNIQQTPKNM